MDYQPRDELARVARDVQRHWESHGFQSYGQQTCPIRRRVAVNVADSANLFSLVS